MLVEKKLNTYVFCINRLNADFLTNIVNTVAFDFKIYFCRDKPIIGRGLKFLSMLESSQDT